MARTARTVERSASGPSSVGSSSNGDSSDAKIRNCEQHISTSNNNCSNSGSAAAAMSASRSISVVIAAPNAARTTSNPMLGRSDSGYARASTTVARMPSAESERANSRPAPKNNAGHYNYSGPRQDNRTRYSPYYRHGGRNQGQNSWDASRGRGRRGSDSQQYFGTGGQQHSRQYNHLDKSYRDRSFDRRDGRDSWEYDQRRNDDGRWGRTRDWNMDHHRPHDQPYHRPYYHHDRPRDTNGGNYNFSGNNESRNNCSPHKRQKYGHHHGHDNNSNNNWHRGGPRGQNHSRHEQHNNHNNEHHVRVLTLHVARLEKDIKGLKESQQNQLVNRPSSSSNVDDESARGGVVSQNKIVSTGSPMTEVHQHQSDTPSDVRAADLIVGLPNNNAVQQNPADLHRDTNNIKTPAVQQNPTDRSHDTNNIEIQKENEACFDVSTDEDINFSPQDASSNGQEDARQDADSNSPSDPGENGNTDATEDHIGDEAGSTDHPEENRNNQVAEDNTIDEDNDGSGDGAASAVNPGDNGAMAKAMVQAMLIILGKAETLKLLKIIPTTKCWGASQAKFYHIRNNCGNSDSGDGTYGNTHLFHKGCCHGDKASNDEYLSPMTRAINESIDPKKKKKGSLSKLDTYTEIKTAYNTAKREESRFENEEFEEAKDCSIYSSPIFERCSKAFSQRNKTRRSPLRVLDLFSGIGSGAVVLKRLKLPIHTMVHVEHDPVAVEVCKFNHKDDGIFHIYVETFEEVYGVNYDADDGIVRSMVDKYGPFDLVLSAAPCQSYSGMNASRDETSENAGYLLKVGRLIQKLDEIQMGSRNVKDNVLFLSENVVFKDHDKVVDKCYLNGLPPLRVNAKDFSGCKRDRFHWINIPLNNSEDIKLVASAVSVDGLLDEGYGAVARLVEGEDESMLTVKANAFLASLARIDDSRMIKYRDEESGPSAKTKKYHIETYSVGEREKMMGLPVGYVEEPIRRLFSDLTYKAFLHPETSEGKSYRDFLPKHLWDFRRQCKFKFRTNSEPPFFQLALSSPLEGKLQLAFYEEEQYCKHLIGNGWSIPVIEYLLGKLTDLFPDDMLPSYDGYTDPHPWEPYMSM